MSTYDFDKVLSEYANGRMNVEMAMGHSLQHLGKLYAALTTATTSRAAEQAKLDALEKRVHLQQAAIDRLLALMDKVLATSKRKPASQPKPYQP
jgi:anti-sigma factor ChrR (cupin superfamily)